MPTPTSDPRPGGGHADSGYAGDGPPGDGLPPWAADLLAAPLPAEADALERARRRVMDEVRRAPRHGRPLARAYQLRAAAPRWARRRGLLAPGGLFAGGALLACALAAALSAAGARLGPGAGGPLGLAAGLSATATVLGDTVLGGTVLGDSVLGRALLGGRALGAPLGDAVRATVRATVRDTLRVVRFALAGPAARAATRVALAGDFTGWRPAAPLARDGRTGAWAVTLVVPRDAVRYAFVVDGAGARRWVPAAALPAGRATAGDST